VKVYECMPYGQLKVDKFFTGIDGRAYAAINRLPGDYAELSASAMRALGQALLKAADDAEEAHLDATWRAHGPRAKGRAERQHQRRVAQSQRPA
jgi:chorismate-pyruvate lyase